MARIFSATTEGERAVAAATARTVLQLKGVATVKARIVEWGISFDGVSGAAEPVVVRLLRQTTAGTSSGATEVAYDEDDPVAVVTAFHTFTSTEPTAGGVLEVHEIHPQGGIAKQYPLGREPVLDADAAKYIGIEVNAPAAVNAAAYIVWEE